MNPDIRQKLFDYSEVPPPSAWEGIASALDNPPFAERLHRFEATPPEGVWEKVAAQLPAPAKVVPLRTKLFKVAIAAAVLGAIAAGSIFYLKNDAAPTLATQPQNTTPEDSDDSANGYVQQPQSIMSEDDATGYNDLTLNPAHAKKTFVQFPAQVRIAKKPVDARAITIDPETRPLIDTESADRYMIALTASGKAVRIPKKCYTDYACLNAYLSEDCKERLSDIHNKMAASVATDFTEFMDLLKNLQEAP